MLQFGSIVIAGFGYSNFNTILVSLPISVFTFIWVIMSTIITSKFRRSRCITAACLSLISLAGCLMVSQIDPSKKVARLAGMWLFPAYSAGIPIILSIIASNVGGYTKRTTVSAVVFIGNCAGNITGPFLFFSNEKPNYNSAWIGIMISLAIAFIAILSLRQLLHIQNQHRNSQQNVNIDPESPEPIDNEGFAVLAKDETDWENPKFRYYL
ncbi:uncharacterized protein N7496_004101 [Penicillium cataractarum]|uniref:Major facilitator superfamily (MFS) profile domain-containing protein n=1 Tax=Penicillium cataractarum TaxID=2100454 RepID=A0A9W9SSJ3_9EURO|nr:uncharacterized protein N7496_004101 [Penicillium cataractarum]KAJ5381673.1 hypothetical protein N7496_004101 [Penicillium cataractarum]